eukprot:NODE_7658_length_1560_cov_5.916260.p1 GENE.NODE_7658_length_1560_cov_5.916260~~NODE_7658_length_1560_cov_5.916260.p1  ORF type:complete len:372 (+),score=51.95 NODE_7658_length_1560_cov_5.916260:45-1160(+)
MVENKEFLRKFYIANRGFLCLLVVITYITIMSIVFSYKVVEADWLGKWEVDDSDAKYMFICEFEAPSSSCGNWSYFDDSCYKAYPNLDWNSAQTACEDDGAFLTTISSSEENTAVLAIADAFYDEESSDYDYVDTDVFHFCWIGLQNSGGGWSWTEDGSSADDFSNWQNDDAKKGSAGDCVGMITTAWVDMMKEWIAVIRISSAIYLMIFIIGHTIILILGIVGMKGQNMCLITCGACGDGTCAGFGITLAILSGMWEMYYGLVLYFLVFIVGITLSVIGCMFCCSKSPPPTALPPVSYGPPPIVMGQPVMGQPIVGQPIMVAPTPTATGYTPGQPTATGYTPGQPPATGYTPGQPAATESNAVEYTNSAV